MRGLGRELVAEILHQALDHAQATMPPSPCLWVGLVCLAADALYDKPNAVIEPSGNVDDGTARALPDNVGKLQCSITTTIKPFQLVGITAICENGSDDGLE